MEETDFHTLNAYALHLTTLPTVTPIRTRNDYLPIETTRRLINRLETLNILKPEDETYSFYTKHRHTKPHPKTYAIDHQRLNDLLEQHNNAMSPRPQTQPTNAALDILIRLILNQPNLDNQHTHDALLMNLRPELRLPYLRQLKQRREGGTPTLTNNTKTYETNYSQPIHETKTGTNLPLRLEDQTLHK